MRWKLAGLLVAVLTLADVAGPARAEQEIQIFVNGVKLEVATASVGGRTLVPLRALFETMGATVEWDGATRTVLATWDGGNMSLPIGSSQAIVNGQTVELDVPAQLVNNSTMVPLRFVAESMGALVGWYENSRVITINRPARAPVAATVTRTVDGDTLDLIFVDGRSERLRLIGVDTPETVHPTVGEQPGGREASAFTQERLTGQPVLVELDVEERDRYGRLLGYVYTSDGAMFNATLVDQGHAWVATYPPNVRYVDVFLAVMAAAQEAWNSRPDRWNFELTRICDDFDVDPSNDCPDPFQDNNPGPGQVRTPTSPVSQGLRYDPFGPDRDCSDFDTWEEAQTFFLAAGGPERDPHRLDSDRDGIACETLRR